MKRTAIVTGGTGGLGSAVVGAPARRRLARRGALDRRARARAGASERDGLELVQADLFDADAVGEVVAAGGGDAEAPLRGAGQPRRRVCDGRPRARDADRGVRAAVPAQPPPDLPDDPAARARTWSRPAAASIVCVGTRAALQPVQRRGRLHRLQGRGDRVRPGGRGRVQATTAIRCNAILPSVIDTPANRASMPKADHAQVGQAGRDRRRRSRICCPTRSEPTSGAAIPVYGRA